MKASTAQIACASAVVGAAALYHHSRKVNRAQRALSFEGDATSNIGWPASSDVMNDPYLVQSILDFVGLGSTCTSRRSASLCISATAAFRQSGA
jgi:hypothetical protein